MSSYSLQPYASYIVAKLSTTNQAATAAELWRVVEETLRPESGWVQLSDITPTVPETPNLAFAMAATENRPVAWAMREGGPNDSLNHLIVGFFSGDFAAIYVSDADLKTTLQTALVKHQLIPLLPVGEQLLSQCYVATENIKSLWLGGAHRPVAVKADSKILSGRQLEHALDPFGDSTYVAGAVRSEVSVGGVKRTVGVSMSRSGVWIGPARDWSSFADYASHILYTLNSTTTTPGSGRIKGLATLVDSFNGVGAGYIVEWADPATSSGSTRAKKLAQLQSEFAIELSPRTGLNAGEVCVSVTALAHTPSPTKQFVLTPLLTGSSVQYSIPATTDPNFQKWVSQVNSDSEFIRIYYETGHSISSGKLALSAVQDHDFNFCFLDFSLSGTGVDYKVDQEKPPGNPVPFSDIEKSSDTSLFKWVYRDGLVQLGLSTPTPGKCWLFTDDGAGELADFVLLDISLPTKPSLTLFHVKGANSISPSRRPSPGAYELVSAQAMKNLRRMQAGNLLDELKKKLATSGASRTWDQPWSSAASTSATASTDLLGAITGLAAASNTVSYEVVIVQPHVLQSRYTPNPAGAWSTASQQLRTLLFGASTMAHAASAKFRVVADMR